MRIGLSETFPNTKTVGSHDVFLRGASTDVVF